jgi:putative hemolysin
LLPKGIGLNHPEVQNVNAMKMFLSSQRLYLVITLNRVFLLVLQIRPSADGKVTEEEIKAIIKEGTEAVKYRKSSKIS